MITMSNSSLVSYKKLSPNHSGKRTHSIDRITPHCVVGQLSARKIANLFTSTTRQASCNYAIGADAKVSLVVDEGNRSWCSSSKANDQRAVTIECASDVESPYAFKSAVYDKLVDLCVDICKRNGKKKLLWLGNKEKTLAYKPKSDEMVLTVHRWFANKACPGDWLMKRMDDLAEKVTKKLTAQKPHTSPTSDSKKQTNKSRGKTSEPHRAVTASSDGKIKVGSSVRLKKGAKTYSNGALASFVYNRVHKVKEINGNRVVITYNGTVVAAVRKEDLALV